MRHDQGAGKGGGKRRGNGYAVRVDQHGDTWANGNIPVYCVVYDPDTKRLHWANATQQLRWFGAETEEPGPFRPRASSPQPTLGRRTQETLPRTMASALNVSVPLVEPIT
jgi:hypothetical protein